MKRIVLTLTDEDHARLRRLAYRDRRTPPMEARVLVERILDLAGSGPTVIAGPGPILVGPGDGR